MAKEASGGKMRLSPFAVSNTSLGKEYCCQPQSAGGEVGSQAGTLLCLL